MKIKNFSDYSVEMRKCVFITQIWDVSLLNMASCTCALITPNEISPVQKEIDMHA